MSNTSENLCYLLWKHKLDREDWSRQLAEWAKCSQDRADELLLNSELNNDEQKKIAQVLDLPEEELQYVRLLDMDHIDILHENVKFLLGQLQRGKKQELAHHLGIHPTTLTKWVSHETLPTPTHQAGLRRYFGIAANINLTNQPIFLSPIPVIDMERRAWLRYKIDHLSSETLEKLFPALVRLLKSK